MNIHPTAVVDPKAHIDSTVIIAPYVIIDGPVQIGPETKIGAHTVISGHTTIGARNAIHSFCSIGAPPQDIHYKGEPTRLIIGDDNLIREYVSIHRGTVKGNKETRIGNRNMIMAYCHIAHDCIVGDDCVFSNNATLAGHVVIGNQVILSGFAGVHQFCRIGDHAFIGMGAFVNGDVPPFVMVAQEKYARARGINAEGLKRRGFDAARIAAIKRAYRALYMGDAKLDEAKAELGEIATGSDDVREMLDFIERGERPLLR